jgi:hypothetical protein
VSAFRAVLFDAGDTLIRLSGGGDRLLRRAAAVLGHDRLDTAGAARVWQEILRQASTPEELTKGRDLSADRRPFPTRSRLCGPCMVEACGWESSATRASSGVRCSMLACLPDSG